MLCLRLLGVPNRAVTATSTSESCSERRSRPQNWSMDTVTCGGRRTSSRTDGCQCTRSLRDVLVSAPTEAHCAATGRIKSTVTLGYPVEFGGAALARRGVVGGGEGMHAENATVTSGDGVKASHQAVLPRKNLQHA